MTRATIGIFSLHVGRMGTACQHDGLEEEAHRFSLHFGDVEADVVQQIGIVLEIGAQLRLKEARCDHIAGSRNISRNAAMKAVAVPASAPPARSALARPGERMAVLPCEPVV